MKNSFLKTIGAAALTVLILALFTQISVSAQQEEKSDQLTEIESFSLLGKAAGSEGSATGSGSSWDVQVTFTNCQTGAPLRPVFPSLSTYMADGTMQEFGVGAGLFRGPGHGVWAYTGGRSFSNSFQFFRFNSDGTYAGKIIVRKRIEVTSNNSYVATSATETYDTGGILLMRGCATETATRFQ
jgi:hypothetical protein